MSENNDDEEGLGIYWDDLHLTGRHRTGRQQEGSNHAAEEQAFRDSVQLGDLVIGTSRENPLVIVKPDGTHRFAPRYRPDVAASSFWQAVGEQRYHYEEQILIIRHMEGILVQLGAADMQLEALRHASQAGDAEAANQAGHAQARLEMIMSQAIELGRGLARRPEIPTPAIPDRIPDRIRTNPASEYQGRDAISDPLPDEPEPT